jgi:hypothetical protein
MQESFSNAFINLKHFSLAQPLVEKPACPLSSNLAVSRGDFFITLIKLFNLLLVQLQNMLASTCSANDIVVMKYKLHQ